MRKIFTTMVLLTMVVLLSFAGGQQPEEEIGIVEPQAREDVIILKLAHADPVNVYTSRKHAQAVAFANLVNARSGGRIEVQIFGAGALGGEREYIEAVKQGTIQCGLASGALASFFPSAMVTDIPYLFPTAPIAWDVLDGPFGDKLSEMLLEETGIRNLGFAEVGFRNFTNDVRPIHTPADMRGLKFRVQETPLYVKMVEGMGAIPTPIAWTETYTALQTGVVDGQENPVAVILMANFSEVQKYLVLDGHVYGVDWFLINDAFFSSLPADLQYILLDSAKIANGVGRGVQQLIGATGIAKLIEQGMEVYVPSEAEKKLFQDAAQQPVIDWLKTQIDPALIREILREVEKEVALLKSEL